MEATVWQEGEAASGTCPQLAPESRPRGLFSWPPAPPPCLLIRSLVFQAISSADPLPSPWPQLGDGATSPRQEGSEGAPPVCVGGTPARDRIPGRLSQHRLVWARVVWHGVPWGGRGHETPAA